MKKIITRKLTVLISILMLLAIDGSAQELVLKNGLYYKKDMLYTGIHIDFHKKDIVKSYFEIKNGLLDGQTTYFYPNGQKEEQRTYKNGEKHGSWINWNPEGIKIAEAHFSYGKKHGKWFIWNMYGHLLYEMEYNLGQKSGTWKMYDDKGKLIKDVTF